MVTAVLLQQRFLRRSMTLLQNRQLRSPADGLIINLASTVE